MIVRDARAGELARIDELRVAAYRAGGLLSANPGCAEVLRGLGISGTGEVLVAEDNGRLVGTVMHKPFCRFSEIARNPGEAEVRALAVAPHEQHRDHAGDHDAGPRQHGRRSRMWLHQVQQGSRFGAPHTLPNPPGTAHPAR